MTALLQAEGVAGDGQVRRAAGMAHGSLSASTCWMDDG